MIITHIKRPETNDAQELYTCFHFMSHNIPHIQTICVTIGEEGKETQWKLDKMGYALLAPLEV